eukprot:scaffold1525_cov142-Cylindrotheca_fusiformis.AAC.123
MGYNHSHFHVQQYLRHEPTVVLSLYSNTKQVWLGVIFLTKIRRTNTNSMRFLEAATILGQTLPILALNPRALELDLGHKRNEIGRLTQLGKSTNGNMGRFGGSRRLRPHRIFKRELSKDYRQLGFKSSSNQRASGALRNSPRERGEIRECDPAATSEADVGVLQCGVDEYCFESNGSKLTGFCVHNETFGELNQRSLQSSFYPQPTACEPDHQDFGSYDCDCSTFDTERNVGSFQCNLNEYGCIREDLCGSIDMTHTLWSDGAARADYCYAFQKPYDISLCYSVDTQRTCNISVQSVDCAKCELVDGVIHPVYGFVGYNCYEFDCRNTLAGNAGNNCAGTYVLDALNGLTEPSSQPSTQPPSRQPSSLPSQKPSEHPTATPTVTFSAAPTLNPSSAPSIIPSSIPTNVPSSHPSSTPTHVASLEPTTSPSLFPTLQPSDYPTQTPSMTPSYIPSQKRSLAPSQRASGSPSITPSQHPSESTLEPSSMPSFEPWNESKDREADESRGRSPSSSIHFSYLTPAAFSLPLLVASAIVYAVQFA